MFFVHYIIIIISNPEKLKYVVNSCRLIRPLPTCGKLIEKLLLKRLSPIVYKKKMTPG